MVFGHVQRSFGLLRIEELGSFVLVSQENGVLRIELRRVPVDLGAIVRAICESGMPHAELCAQDWH
jgi:hypothetical protein